MDPAAQRFGRANQISLGQAWSEADRTDIDPRGQRGFMSLEAHRLGESLVPEQLHPPRPGAAEAGITSGDAAGPDKSRGAWQRAFPLQQERHLIKARHNIYRAGENLSGVPIVHSGWAARVRRLPDGRRQILSFILPGELISAGAVFADRLSFHVEAITDVRYAVYRRTEPAELLTRDPDLLQALISGCLAEKAELEELATDLGRRRAEERIARLFLQLRNRLQALGQAPGMSFDMPLRQQHIADATGMTVIHVGRVMGALRNDGIIQLSGGVLAITDLAALKRLAEV
jgi:CRP-like cAMP-binding protein